MRSRRRSAARAPTSVAACARRRASRSSWRSGPGSSSSWRASPARRGSPRILRYGLNHWEGLVRFLDDGRIELDTNIVERGIRPIVLNRKNALFAGHDEGAENWACVASLIETLQAQRRRSASLLRRRPRQARQSLARLAHRRTHALGMAQSSRRPSTRGLTRSLKVNLPTPWDVKTAYG